MPNFLPTEYKQDVFIALNFEEQLVSGTFEHALHYLFEEKIDLSVFDARYKNDKNGRAAYSPTVLLKVILFAYYKGITSSREIGWCCRNNIIFRALSCDTAPHFTTIADFISRQPSDIENIFEQVLLVCHQEGLIGNDLFALDGCKMRSDASKTWSGTFKELAEKRDKIKRLIQYHTKRHREIDRTEADANERQARHKQAKETLSNAFDKIDNFLKNNEPRKGTGKRPTEVKSNITDNESAKMTTSKGTIQGFNGIATVDTYCQVIIDAQAFGEGQEPHTLKPVLEAVKARFQRLKINKDIYKTGVLVTGDTGYANEGNMQYLKENGINAYVPDNQFRSRDERFSHHKKKHGKRHQDRPKTNHKYLQPHQFDFNKRKKSCVCPAGETMWIKNESKDNYGNLKIYFEGKLTSCRNCHIKAQCMKNPSSADTRDGHGRQVSFILKKGKSNTPYTDWMKKRVDSDYGKMVYAHRMSTVEPVFANIGTNKRLDRFSLRGKAKVQGQWQLYCLVHNIEKLMNYGESLS